MTRFRIGLGYAGPIECPNCHSPISSDAMVCPYCSSASPASAPWRQHGTWPIIAGLGVAVALGWAFDHFLGTHVLATLWEWVPKDAS
jgi:hypothetical protein